MANNDLVMSMLQGFLAVVMLFFLYLKNTGTPIIMFWFCFWSLVVVTLLILFFSSMKHKIVALIILEAALTFIYVFGLPLSFQMDRDAYFESEYAAELINTGWWDPTMGMGFAENYYGHNPILHFLLAALSVSTGLSTHFLGKYVLLVFLRVVLTIAVLALIRLFIKKESTAFLSFFVFLSCYGLSYVMLSRRLVADIFLILCIYSIFSQDKIIKRLFFVFAPMAILSNHSIAYLLMGILVLLSAGRMLLEKIRPKNVHMIPKSINMMVLYYMAFIIIWESFFAAYLLANDLSYLKEISQMIFSGYAFGMLRGIGTSSPSIFQYHAYELWTIYAYNLIFLVLAGLGIITLIFDSRYKEAFSNRTFILLVGLLSGMAYVGSFILMRTELDSAAYTFLWFFSIPLSVLAGYFLDKLRIKLDAQKYLLAMIAVSLILFSGYLMSGMYTPRITNRMYEEGLVLGMDARSQTPGVFYSAFWLKRNSAENSHILGDINTFEIYSGFFSMRVSDDKNVLRELLMNDSMGWALESEAYFGSYEHTYYFSKYEYFVLNDLLVDSPNYIFPVPPGDGSVAMLGENRRVDRVYDNSDIAIYRNFN
jgi:hypothetical protein